MTDFFLSVECAVLVFFGLLIDSIFCAVVLLLLKFVEILLFLGMISDGLLLVVSLILS